MKNARILILDNYDSFTYNLVQIVERLDQGEVFVKRNDQIQIEEVEDYDYLIFSPGPGLPDEAGLLKDIILHYKESKKMLGVCLGLQAIGEVFGCSLRNLSKVFHGQKTTMVQTEHPSPLFEGIPDAFEAGRYHSWVIDKDTLTKELIVSAMDEEKEIMAVHHSTYPIYGVQFHPESIMTPEGTRIIANFINL